MAKNRFDQVARIITSVAMSEPVNSDARLTARLLITGALKEGVITVDQLPALRDAYRQGREASEPIETPNMDAYMASIGIPTTPNQAIVEEINTLTNRVQQPRELGAYAFHVLDEMDHALDPE